MIKELIILVLAAITRRVCGCRATESYGVAFDYIFEEHKLLKRHFEGRKHLRKLRGCRDLKLNIGCGPNAKAGWVNLDMSGGSNVYAMDLRESIPLDSGSCSLIYSEHFFEHIDYPRKADALLRDYFRLLRPGGRLSIGVPDAEEGLMAYANNNLEWFAVCKSRWHPQWANTKMEQINYLFRQDGEHRFAYDAETLSGALKRAGFSNVHRRPFDPEIDSGSRSWGSLYIDANRPD